MNDEIREQKMGWNGKKNSPQQIFTTAPTKGNILHMKRVIRECLMNHKYK